ncbi:MAG TPA: Ig-like domain-containing protein, partial [Vicinamibacteria bacterium]|nr:Ig-like domain-containing protein [Vicinamibacteria bacterium]
NLSSVPTVGRVDVPKPVAADTQKAVDLILERLGRPAPPAAVLREALFGRPVEAAIGDVLEAPTAYLGKAVRLRGRLDAPEGKGEYRLVDGDQSVVVVPDAELVPFFRSKVADWKGLDVELVGAFGRGRAAQPGHVVSFWDCTASKAESVPAKGKRATLAALFAEPNAWLGETVRVVGKFRGRDLFGDFPHGTRSGGDWVIKDDRYALWVIGRPAGAGFALDPTAVADTNAWVEIVGQPVVRSRRLALRARSVALVPPPPGARVVPPRRLVGRQFPPAVVFSLPLDGEAVTPDTRFVIQFSKQMDETSFTGRVRLRYADQAEGSGFRVTAGYDDARRSLVVDPGTPLVASQLVEIQLLPGILDIDGMALVPRPGRAAGEAVDVLRYRVVDGDPE